MDRPFLTLLDMRQAWAMGWTGRMGIKKQLCFSAHLVFYFILTRLLSMHLVFFKTFDF